MGVGGQRHVPAALITGMTRYQMYRGLGGQQGRSGRVRKILPPKGFDKYAYYIAENHILLQGRAAFWNEHPVHTTLFIINQQRHYFGTVYIQKDGGKERAGSLLFNTKYLPSVS